MITGVENVIVSGVALGKTKAPKLSKQSKHPTVYLGDGVFSVQYWQFHRCFALLFFSMNIKPPRPSFGFGFAIRLSSLSYKNFNHLWQSFQ